MKIVIDIPEDFYAVCKEWVADYCANIEQAIIAEGIPLQQGDYARGFIDALDKAFSKFDANCTYSGDRVLQKLEKLKEEEDMKGGAK